MAKYKNYKSNLETLRKAPEKDLNDEFIQSGVINKFSVQFELAWKLLQKILLHEGRLDGASGSPRDVLKSAYSTYNFIDEDIWLTMLESRSQISHIYDSEKAEKLVDAIVDSFIPTFEFLLCNLEERYGQDLLESF